MGTQWSGLLEEGIVAMTSGDAVRAKDAFERLERAAESYDCDEAKFLSSAWEPFVHLLGRRGYFVRDLAETRVSLEEILEMGPGFDLYDLAASLSRCDIALATHLRASSSRVFPELKPFISNHHGDAETPAPPKPDA